LNDSTVNYTTSNYSNNKAHSHPYHLCLSAPDSIFEKDLSMKKFLRGLRPFSEICFCFLKGFTLAPWQGHCEISFVDSRVCDGSFVSTWVSQVSHTHRMVIKTILWLSVLVSIDFFDSAAKLIVCYSRK